MRPLVPFAMNPKLASTGWSSAEQLVVGRQDRCGGFSLVEVLLIIAMLSVTILPFTLVMSQTAGNARGSYVQSSRSILLDSLMDEATVDRDDFVYSYPNAMTSTVSESGQVLPFMRQPDTRAGISDTFSKTIYYYLYNNATDAHNAPRYKTKQVLNRDTMRVRFDAWQYGLVDASGFYWSYYDWYDAGNAIPGYVGTYQSGVDGTTIVNLPSSHADQELYTSEWYNNSAAIQYAAPVSNGLYTVKLYFSERNYPNARLVDIYLENKLMNPGAPYNPSQTCGGRSYCANARMFDVMVTDGTLNVKIDLNASATHPYRQVNAIFIKKRT